MGVIYGIIPHSFCIAFAALSIFGATTATSLIRPIVENQYFDLIMVVVAIIFATLSAVFHLASHKSLSFAGIKKSWRYLSILYITTIAINLILFFAILPAITKYSLKRGGNIITEENLYASYDKLTLEVAIPCSSHAFLVVDDLKKLKGVKDVRLNDIYFDVYFDKKEVSIEQILGIDLFKEYSAKLVE